ncbi:MAG: hypothetical protein F6J93_12910 [Oscillatoria sp. SIO1A7]|nr:hypothetical protein [Oscillatoria sp. SIO1A7]
MRSVAKTKANFSQGKPTRCRDRVRYRRGFGVGYLPTGASYWSKPKDNFPQVQGLPHASPVFKGEVFVFE